MYVLIFLMHINTELLETFLTIHTHGSFTLAASELGLSQSAISQKMARLEDRLQVTIFIRKSEGLYLTAAGEKLLSFAKQQLLLEKEFVQDFQENTQELRGILRIAAFSSVVRSALIPSLAPFLRSHARVSVEFSSHEMDDLPKALKQNQADIIITDFSPQLPGSEEILLGKEEYIVIESSKHSQIPEIYLDHGPHDNATETYFKHQGQNINYHRGFMGDVYGILDGVSQGLGRAVMSKHLVKGDKRFKVKRYKRKYQRPVVLSYFKQAYYSPLQKAVTDQLVSHFSTFL
jgi:DNA-binding transcriptional LysR family regulator